MATLADIEQALNALIQARDRLAVGLQNTPAMQSLAALQKGIATLCDIPEAREIHQKLARIHTVLNTPIPPDVAEKIRRFVAEPLSVAPMPGIPSSNLSPSLAAEAPAPMPSPTQERRRIGIQHAYARKTGRGQ